LLSKYKLYRNFLNALIKKTKNDFYKNKIMLCNNDRASIWKVINEVTDGGSKHSIAGNEIKDVTVSNKTISSNEQPIEVANGFVDYFTNIGSSLAHIIKNKPSFSHSRVYQHPQIKIEESIKFQPISENEISHLISKLKDTSACGIDDIQVVTIKKIKLFILEPLVHIFNLCLKHGVFPDSLKIAVIKPIHKAKEKHLIGNYRPISLLTHFSKLLEKCIKSRVIAFLDKHNIISDSQFGFRPNLSTQDAIYSLTTEIAENVDKSRKTLAVFLDLAKAFDTVEHSL
jgi:Reverse transcriptase (RNA-dependent DNA polymerase)